MEPTDPLLSIGVFARRSLLSVKALRIYDRLGLLPPADVDPSSGYRRYRESQLATARLVVLLRRLDMPLAQIEQVAAAPAGCAAELVAAYWDAAERRIAGQRELAAHVQRILAGGNGSFGRLEIREREVPEQLLLTEQRHLLINELEPWMAAATSRLQYAARQLGGATAGAFRIFHGEVDEDNDGPVEVCVPLSRTWSHTTGVATRPDPAHRELYVRVTAAQYEYPQILSAYHAVEQQMEATGRCCAGPPREIILDGVDPARVAPDDEVCDVAYPVC